MLLEIHLKLERVTLLSLTITGYQPSLTLGSTILGNKEYSTGKQDGRRNLSKKNYERDLEKEHMYKRDSMSNAERYEHSKRMGKDIGRLN